MKSCRIYQVYFLAAIALLTQVQQVTGQGNVIANGDFEAGSQGWTFFRGAHVVLDLVPGPGMLGVILASTNAGPAGEPTVSQSLAGLLPGATYLVSGDYEPEKNRGGASPTNASFGVAFDGTYVFQMVATPVGPWQHFSFYYTVQSASEVLSLTSQINGTGVEYTIDNISMVVPEPGSVSLFAVGASLMVAARRSSRQKPLPP